METFPSCVAGLDCVQLLRLAGRAPFKGPSCFQFHQMTENGKGGVDMRLTCSGMPGSSSSSARTENFNFVSDRPKDMLLGLPRRSIHQSTESLRPVIRQRPQVQSLILYM